MMYMYFNLLNCWPIYAVCFCCNLDLKKNISCEQCHCSLLLCVKYLPYIKVHGVIFLVSSVRIFEALLGSFMLDIVWAVLDSIVSMSCVCLPKAGN